MSSLIEKIAAVKARLKKEFLHDTRPWVVTFSGGKDSTTVLHLVVEMLMELRKEGHKQLKKVYVVSSDTGVEMPLIEDYTTDKIRQIQDFLQKEQLNIEIALLKPKVRASGRCCLAKVTPHQIKTSVGVRIG